MEPRVKGIIINNNNNERGSVFNIKEFLFSIENVTICRLYKYIGIEFNKKTNLIFLWIIDFLFFSRDVDLLTMFTSWR